MAALEKRKYDDEACGEIETAHPGNLGSQDTFYVGTFKGVGRVYQQTCVDTCNNERTHQGKMCFGRTPIDTLIDDKKSGRKSFLITLNLTATLEKTGAVRSDLSRCISSNDYQFLRL